MQEPTPANDQSPKRTRPEFGPSVPELRSGVPEHGRAFTIDLLTERAFAEAMRSARNHQHISQVALTRILWDKWRIKLDGTAITRMERHITNSQEARAIRLGEAAAIAATLGFSIDELVKPDAAQQLHLVRWERDHARRRLEALEREQQRATSDLLRYEQAVANLEQDLLGPRHGQHS